MAQPRVRLAEQTPRRVAQNRVQLLIRRQVALAAALVSVTRAQPADAFRSSLRWPQDALDHAIRSLCRVPMGSPLRMPILEDIINSSPFTDLVTWCCDRGLDHPSQSAHLVFTRPGRRSATSWTGMQTEAYTSAGFLHQMVPFGLTKDEHFSAATRVAMGPTPLEARAPANADLCFAASMMAKYRPVMRDTRLFPVGAVERLAGRVQPLSEQLRPLCMKKTLPASFPCTLPSWSSSYWFWDGVM